MTSPADLARPDLGQARAAYDALVAQGMKLDLTRGKPSAAQLDLATELLHLPGDRYKAADGTDTRNYEGLQGLPELREIFAPVLQVPVEQLVAFGNGSLELMHDTLVNALLNAMPGSPRRWVEEERVVFLAPVPGYDRHFGVCERLGIELVPVPLNDDGPDMDEVERLVAADPSIKGIWCVPKYSNPTGIVYSDETVRRLATMPTAAPDFRIMWDNAYAVHTLTEEPAKIADLLALATEAGNADRVFVFGSTSKITLAGAGVAFFGASPANLKWWLAVTEQAHHRPGQDQPPAARDVPARRRGRRGAHAQAPRDRRAEVRRAGAHPQRELRRHPRRLLVHAGGRLLRHAARCPTAARRRSCGWRRRRASRSPPPGATHPYGKDPDDAIIRLAPTFPVLDEVEKAMAGVAVCVKLALAQRDPARPRGAGRRTCSDAAVRLLGCTLEADTPDGTVAVRLVEVEAYRGADDPASHSFRGRTPRNAVMFGPPGTCTSTSSTACTSAPTSSACAEGDAGAVLLRAGEVVSDLGGRARPAPDRARRDADLARGPARLAALLGLDRADNGLDLIDPASRVRLDAGRAGRRRRRCAPGPRVGVAAAHDTPVAVLGGTARRR